MRDNGELRRAERRAWHGLIMALAHRFPPPW
jgi:hypothetical protein